MTVHSLAQGARGQCFVAFALLFSAGHARLRRLWDMRLWQATGTCVHRHCLVGKRGLRGVVRCGRVGLLLLTARQRTRLSPIL